MASRQNFSLVFCSLFFTIGSLHFSVAKDNTELSHNVKHLKQTISSYNQRLTMLTSELNKAKEKLDDLRLQDQLEKRDLRLVQDHVAFTSQLTTDLASVPNYQTIIFDKIVTNIGSAYNSSNGVFTVPVNGTYAFSWVTTNRDHSYMNTELTVNGIMFGKAMSDAMDHQDYAVATNIGVVTLTEEDLVWIRSGTWHSGKIAGDLYSTFSGWLLF